MRKVIIIIVLCISSLIGFGQEIKTCLDYDSLIELVESNDTIALSQALNGKALKDVYDTTQLPLLFYACSKGSDINMVEYLLSRGANPNSISKYGIPAHWAGEEGDLDKISLLMDYGFDARIEEMGYWMEISNSEDVFIPQWMKDIIFDLNASGTDYSNYPYTEYIDPADPMLLSAAIYFDKSGKYDLANRMIAQGVNVDLIDKKGMTALLYSVVHLDTLSVKFLIDKNANVNLPLHSRRQFEYTSDTLFNDNLTPLHLLLHLVLEKPEMIRDSKVKILRITEMLVDAGADVNAKTKYEKQSVQQIARKIDDEELIKIIKEFQ